MPYVLLGCQIALSLVFLLSATSKMLSPKQFVIALQVSRIPTLIVYPLATLIVGLEVILALSLLLNAPLPLALALPGTLMLLGSFTSWLVWVYRKRISVQCGCFGQSKSDVSIASIIRNIVFIAIAVFTLILLFILHTTSVFIFHTWWPLTLSLILVGCSISVMAKRLYSMTNHQHSSTAPNIA